MYFEKVFKNTVWYQDLVEEMYSEERMAARPKFLLYMSGETLKVCCHVYNAQCEEYIRRVMY